jgi:hypothetical protein
VADSRPSAFDCRTGTRPLTFEGKLGPLTSRPRTPDAHLGIGCMPAVSRFQLVADPLFGDSFIDMVKR